MKQLALVVITQNAQEHIERCIRSVPFASEVVVVDSGSQDETVAIAERLGARVIHQQWMGFGRQKRIAVSHSRYDWILSLDADEALSPELAAYLERWLSETVEDIRAAYRLPRLSYYLGRWIRHGGWYPDWQVRLFDRRHAQWSADSVHEHVEADKIGTMDSGDILHWVFKDLTHQVATNNRYSSLGAQVLFERGRTKSLFHLVTKPWVKFFETYIWKRGFLDGVPGFIIAVGAAYSVFLKWSKLWEMCVLGQDETRS